MEPVITPLIEGLKWVVKQWTEMGSELMGLIKDKPKVEQETDQLSKDLEGLKKKKDWVTGKFKEAEQGVRDMEGKSFGELADKAGLSDEVSPDSEGRSDVTKEQVQAEVGEEIIESDIETKLDEFKSKVEEVNVTPIKVDTSKMKKYETGASPVPETGPAIVHKGEVIIPAPIVKKVGGAMNIENILNTMQSSTSNKMQQSSTSNSIENIINTMQSSTSNKMQQSSTSNSIENIINMMSSSTEKIKKNPLKVISIMEGLANEFAPIGEQLPGIINETIKESKLGTVSNQVSSKMVEKMETTLSILKEQTDYEDPSGSTIVISPPSQSQPSVRGGKGKTEVITIGPSMTGTLNRYYGILLQKALK